jgi:cell division protein FtsQ
MAGAELMNRDSKLFPKGEKRVRTAVEVAGMRRRNRLILRITFAVVVGVDALLAAGVMYLLLVTLPYFNLQQIEVSGNRKLSRAEIIEAAEVEDRTNLLTIDLSAAAERLRRHPWIRYASVSRKLPGNLSIEVEERTPRAVLSAGKLYYVDEHAEFFTRLLPGDSVDYPLFAGVRAEDLTNSAMDVKELIRDGVALLELLDKGGNGLHPSEVSHFMLSMDDGVSVATTGGKTVIFGKADFNQKMKRYGRLKNFLTKTGEWNSARTINLDFEDRALVRWLDKGRVQG